MGQRGGRGGGRGKGRGPGRQGGSKAAGPNGNCICPDCGHKVAHTIAKRPKSSPPGSKQRRKRCRR